MMERFKTERGNGEIGGKHPPPIRRRRSEGDATVVDRPSFEEKRCLEWMDGWGRFDTHLLLSLIKLEPRGDIRVISGEGKVGMRA